MSLRKKILIKSVKVGHFTGKDWYLKVDEDGNPLRRESRMDILRRRSLKNQRTDISLSPRDLSMLQRLS